MKTEIRTPIVVRVENQFDYLVRVDGFAEGANGSFLEAVVTEPYTDKAVEAAFAEWRERWPNMAWPREVEVEVTKLTDRFGASLPRRRAHPKLVTLESGDE